MRVTIHRTEHKTLVKRLLAIQRTQLIVAVLAVVCALVIVWGVLRGWAGSNADYTSVVIVQGPSGVGSGFVVTPEHVLTASHVIAGGEYAELVFRDGQSVTARVLFNDTENDFALLSISGMANPPPPLVLGNSDAVAEKSPVYAIGYIDGEYTITEGIVSERSTAYIKTDAAVNPGNSGGPLVLKETGEALGVIVYTKSIQGQRAEGMHYATPSNVVITACRAKGFDITSGR